MAIIKLCSTPVKFVRSIDQMNCPFFTENRDDAMCFEFETAKGTAAELIKNHGYKLEVLK